MAVTYRKLAGDNSIAASGITVNPTADKRLHEFLVFDSTNNVVDLKAVREIYAGSALYINGTKVLWYEE